MNKYIIDTDGNTEALQAIESILKEQKEKIIAITIVSSFLSLKTAANNVLMMLERNNYNIPVYLGAENPLSQPPKKLSLASHTSSLKKANKTVEEVFAANKIITEATDNDLEIIAMGPLTNIALAIIKNREKMKNIKALNILGGMLFHGDIAPLSEYNFYMDAQAADCVFKFSVPIKLFPIDMGNYSERIKYVFNPDLIEKQYLSYTRIETQGDITYGANINDARDISQTETTAKNTVLREKNCIIVAENTTEIINKEVE
ncbi:MAG: nucleoside hydrolase [Erysipelotrichia bacterium]|nr:nucleoside hydrolase [Erysipelotrichia bacterium]